MQQPIHYAELADVLRAAGYPEDPSGFHGALCGTLCVLPPDEVDLQQLLEAGADDMPRPLPATRSALEQLVEDAFVALMSNEMSFAPLLPGDDAVLMARVHALAAWCEGFLFGVAGHRNLDLQRCSAEAREIIEDLSQFTRAGVDMDADDEVEEAAYTELVEYVRVGAQLVFMELHPRPDPAEDPDAPPPTLH